MKKPTDQKPEEEGEPGPARASTQSSQRRRRTSRIIPEWMLDPDIDIAQEIARLRRLLSPEASREESQSPDTVANPQEKMRDGHLKLTSPVENPTGFSIVKYDDLHKALEWSLHPPRFIPDWMLDPEIDIAQEIARLTWRPASVSPREKPQSHAGIEDVRDFFRPSQERRNPENAFLSREELREAYTELNSFMGISKRFAILKREDIYKALEYAGIDLHEDVGAKWESGMSLRELGKQHGVAHGTIARWVRKSGRTILPRNQNRKHDEDLIAEVYKQTNSVNRAAKAANVHWATARRILKKKGFWGRR